MTALAITVALSDEDKDDIARRTAKHLLDVLSGATLPSPDWFTAAEAANYLGTTRETLNAASRNGEVPRHQRGSRVVYRRQELDLIIATGGFGSRNGKH